MDREVQENLLCAWMQMAVSIRGNRLLSSMSFNETLVCSILYRSQREARMMTLTDLCEATRLYKSQINRILDDMESKKLIQRIQSSEDKRKVYLHLVEENLSVYFIEHEQVMQVVTAVTEMMGPEKSKMLTALMLEATEVVDEYQVMKKITDMKEKLPI